MKRKIHIMLALAATAIILLSACYRNCDEDYPLTQQELQISDNILGIIIEGPWEVLVTQDSAVNSALLEYNVSDSKITARLQNNGYLFIRVSNLRNYKCRTLRATIHATALEKIDASGAAAIKTYGHYSSSCEITLSGASLLNNFICEGRKAELDLSGASIIKNLSFKGERMKARLSGASKATLEEVQLDDYCNVDASGASVFEAGGYAVSATFNGEGASVFETRDLESENLHIDLSGASNAQVTVNHTIKGSLTGASILRYRRAEDVSGVSVTGGSKIIKVE